MTTPATTPAAERCDRCHGRLSPEARRRGWPVAATPPGGDPFADVDYVGPCCLDGYCPSGHVLAADEESSSCPECEG